MNPEIETPLPEDFGIGQLFWAIRDAVVVGDADTGCIVLWNPAAEAMFGIPREQALGLPLDALIPEEFREQHRAGLAAYRETGSGALVDTGALTELPALRSTGERITIELRLSPIATSRFPGNFVLALIRDATVRKQGELDRLRLAEEQGARAAAEAATLALRESETRFRTAFDHAPIGMDLVALDGRFMQVNAALCALFGYSEQELRTMTTIDLTFPEDRAPDEVLVKRMVAGEIPTFQLEKRYIRKDGQVIWGRVNSSVVRDAEGTPLYFIGQVEDITGRIMAEEELRAALADAQAANRAKGVFLDMMSHELRTPLQATLGYSEFLLAGPETSLSVDQRQDVSAIHQASQRMIRLINQLLDLSRLDAGGLSLASEPVDLASVLEQVRQDVAPQVMERGLSLQISVPASLPLVQGDAERVRQILLNLAGNAVKFTEAGSIHIEVALLDASTVEVVVTDTGIGIPADALPHIFDEFYQQNRHLSRRFGGAGLGLAIARKLATQMGGTISVSSEAGAGSIFRLRLPLCPAPVLAAVGAEV
ncbi:MAG: PAS domain S-box protein [Thermomicrobiales bacterium]